MIVFLYIPIWDISYRVGAEKFQIITDSIEGHKGSILNRSSTSSEQYFSYIQDENNLMNTNNCKK
jgi:hypothetical protein